MLGRQEVAQLLLPRAKFLDKLRVSRRLWWIDGFGRYRRLSRTGQYAVERIIVLGGNRIELVVVAPGTSDRQAHETAANDVDPIIDHVVNVAHEPRTDRQKPQRGQRSLTVLRGKLVRCDLFNQEPVVRKIVVEGTDDVVAIGIRPVKISVLKQNIPLGISIPRDVEPVSAPPLAVSRRSQQPIN